MPQVFITADSLLPTGLNPETAYSYGPGPVYSNAQVQIDPAGNTSQGASLIAASNTRGVWVFNGASYKMLNRQRAPRATVILKSLDNGASWTVLDEVNSPAVQTCSGFVSGSTVYCAFNTAADGTAGFINLINFDMNTGMWGPVYGIAGAPAIDRGPSISVWLRPNNTLLVFFSNRSTFNPGDPSGIGGVSFDLGVPGWNAPFDAGAAITALPGWNATNTMVQRTTSVMDASGRVHLFLNATGLNVGPPLWTNRCFHQAFELDDSFGSFTDFPGQDAVGVDGKLALASFSGSPLGGAVIVNDTIVLTVSMTNRLAPPFPPRLANVYLGSPVASPAWIMDDQKTIDPGALIDSLISIQEAPAASFDGTTMYAVYSAQNGTGQNLARLRLCTSTNTGTPADGWFGITIFDLEFDSPPGFNFSAQQFVGEPSIAVPVSVIPILFPFRSAAAGAPKFCPSIKKQPKMDLASLQMAYETQRPPNVEEVCVPTLRDRMKQF